jgi:hypothetical protein
MPRCVRHALVPVLACLVAGALDARGADQPVSAAKLVLRHTSSGQEKLGFVSRDPAFPFPAVGSADDPSTGTPGGVVIELFSPNAGAATLDVPSAPGWKIHAASPVSYEFVNKSAPGGSSTVRSILLKQGKVVRLLGTATGLPLGGPLGPVGVRITIGSLRFCALFAPSTIRRDDPAAFIATRASAASLADCSTASLGGPTCTASLDAPTCGGACPAGSACGTRDLSTCECIAANQPCGDTWPVCNGECPAGQACGNVGGFPLPGCGCIPAPATPCGTTNPSCGGDCPLGEACYPNSISIPIGTFYWCGCSTSPPIDPCGGCPPGYTCYIFPPDGTPTCAP